MIVASGIAMQFGAKPLFENVSVKFGGGNRYGLIGTLLRCLLRPDTGTVKWAEKARPGYWPQDPADEFKGDETLAQWMGRWRRQDRSQDEQVVRATLGQLLFSGDDQKKSLKVISGGEAQRMIIGRLVLSMPNVMLLDEPTNHLDMESIESLNTALDKYPGTLVFAATVIDFHGSYEDYLAGKTAALAAA